MRKLILAISIFILGVLVAVTPAFALSVEGPPAGDAVAIAKDIIFNVAEQPCGKVIKARRVDNGEIIAYCSNGEKYLIAIVKDAPTDDGRRKNFPVAIKCSAAIKIGVVCPK